MTKSHIDSEKPIQSDVEIIAEDVVVTPAFIDLHSHIGMVRAGEPADEDESSDHMHPISPLIMPCIVYTWKMCLLPSLLKMVFFIL